MRAHRMWTRHDRNHLQAAAAFGIRAADNAHTYKTSIKEIAYRHDLVASFMTKPYPEISRSSSHVCHSLWDAEGKVPLLFDAESPSGLSELGHPGGGGHSTFMWTGRCRWGVENLTLSQCARCTKNTPCHNIPY